MFTLGLLYSGPIFVGTLGLFYSGPIFVCTLKLIYNGPIELKRIVLQWAYICWHTRIVLH